MLSVLQATIFDKISLTEKERIYQDNIIKMSTPAFQHECETMVYNSFASRMMGYYNNTPSHWKVDSLFIISRLSDEWKNIYSSAITNTMIAIFQLKIDCNPLKESSAEKDVDINILPAVEYKKVSTPAKRKRGRKRKSKWKH